MITEKMNGLRDQIINPARLKRLLPGNEGKRLSLRSGIMELKNAIDQQMPIRKSGFNRWNDSFVRFLLKKQDRLLRKYVRKYGEFPFEIVDVES